MLNAFADSVSSLFHVVMFSFFLGLKLMRGFTLRRLGEQRAGGAQSLVEVVEPGK